MIQSMTAFARAQAQGKWGSAVCELRSINHRYLEMHIRLPESLHELEVLIRERIRQHVRRGKIECLIRFQSDAGTEIKINTHLAKELCLATDKIAGLLTHAAPVDPVDILHWPGILQIAEVDPELVQDEILNLLEKGLNDLVDARHREGDGLKQLFIQRIECMKTELAKVRQRMPEILQQQRNRFVSKFTEANFEFDSGRLEQEMVIFAQKIDVSEEIERLDSHLSEVRRVLKHGGVVGRRLDFLMQELNREANTLGAKSIDVDTTRASVELKVLIEQIREQVQNVE